MPFRIRGANFFDVRDLWMTAPSSVRRGRKRFGTGLFLVSALTTVLGSRSADACGGVAVRDSRPTATARTEIP